MRMLEINIMTTDQTFVEGLNSAEIEEFGPNIGQQWRMIPQNISVRLS